MTNTFTKIASILAVFCGMATTVHAAPDWQLIELRKDLSTLSDTLAHDGPARGLSLDDLIASQLEIGFQPISRTVPKFSEPDQPASLGWTDMRFTLGKLAHAYGAKDNLDILQAHEKKWHLALSVEDGVATLEQLRRSMSNRQLSYNEKLGAYVLRVPLIIQPGASLRLGPSDKLQLSRKDGAFLISMGHFEAFGASVSGTIDPQPSEPPNLPLLSRFLVRDQHIFLAQLSRI